MIVGLSIGCCRGVGKHIRYERMRVATKIVSRMACNNPNHATPRFSFNIFRECEKFPNSISWSRIISNIRAITDN